MSGPSAPNWAGNTRFIGPTGPAGQNGAAGGLTLFLDSSTSTSVPTTGALLLAPVLTTQTTISFAATNSTVLIAKFPSAVGAIVEETITPGAWDLNIYASASSLTNAPLFYWSLYQVDADGSSNPVLIADGAANEQVITSLTATLQTQSLSIPAVLLPLGKRIACYLYARYRSGGRTATFSFRTGSQSFLSTSIVDSAQNWSEYPAVSSVNLQQYNISNVQTLFTSIISNTSNINTATLNSTTISNSGTITSDTISNTNLTNISNIATSTITAVGGSFTTLSGTLTGNVSGNLTGNVVGNISNSNLTVSGQFSINEVADVGSAVSNYASYGTVNISGKGGLGGIVNITADVATPLNPAVTVSQLTAEAKGNYGLITPGSPVGYVPRGGLVSIIARQGLTPSPPAEVTSALFANGEIDLTAFSYGIVPGLIKLISGANAMYAGAVTPITGVIGYNYVFGQFGNNITAGLPPGGIPTVPGENYIYGLNGTVVDNGLYTDTIYNKFGGDLNLNSRTCNVSITASNATKSITLTSPTINHNGFTTMIIPGTSAIPSVSPLALTNGNDAGASNRTQIELQYQTGGFNHYITTRHFGGTINNSSNAIDFWLYSYNGGGSQQTASSSPGTGNVRTFSISAAGVSVAGTLDMNNNAISNVGSIAISSAGTLNMGGGTISNVGNILGSNLTISTGGNLTLASSTGGSVVCSNNLNMNSNSISNVSNITGIAGGTLNISNTDHFITLPAPGITYATGGTITQDSGRTIHTFTSNGTFTLLVSVGTVEVMGIGGGGGGGGINGGGGGAGNLVVVESALAVGSYTVTVGDGGIGGTAILGGYAGGQSRFTNGSTINIRMLGGGGGSTAGDSGGGNGGCGGGGSSGTESFGGTAGTGVTTGMTSLSNVAFAGGSNPNPSNVDPAGSGGGGVYSVGLGVSGITPSDGGDGGGAYYYLGTMYGGGGGGAAAPNSSYGAPHKGRGGGTAPPTSGGNGSLGATSTQAQPGVANTGGGGGGGESAADGYPGAAGGSGVVIVSYVTPTPPQMTLGTTGEILMNAPTVLISNDLTIGGTTNLNLVNITNLTVETLTVDSNASFNGSNTAITGKLVGQNSKPIAIDTGVATGFWNPTTVGSVTASGAAGFSNADNPSGFAVADFNAYMSLLSFNNLNATDFYLNDQRIQPNSSSTYWSCDCDARAYSPNVYLSNQNVQWVVNAMFIPKSLSSV
jgi:hypothetical protein